MERNDAFYIHRGFMCDLASQSKAIEFLLTSVAEFNQNRLNAEQIAEQLTPDYIKEQRNLPKKTRIFENIPDALIEADLTADHMWHAEAIYSGTLFVVLSSWIQTFGKKLGLSQSQWLDTGNDVNSQKLSKVIWASANNFRHFEEWHTITGHSQPSIDVLSSIGIIGPWNRNVTCEVLGIVAFADREDVWSKMHAVANELFFKATGMHWSNPRAIYEA